ncbi:glutamine--fructose-6-phosphate transaminase (isomerizing) [Halorubrum lacusprofundi]|jgi:glucosamine--fructose-6-phosphate aminotransferase (isomerizing)|uniref:Glutamine--fructose-6-phosphate aminotransferase [isomerizing] n=1 Tax=Halorubrum lacusprofundi (strain ATCC 49239 / DSM 5036 / JCM 8891 / ACAM 34) TaxID=416348 RepID=B9LMT6_HALLT|nr:glutamine--fructose-6-phosphate transaminase (isomerizing) [Halorubrum lacusprofundi]ACM56674.1 glucosamine/fructose-6-phosphate aminotransferase, isomerizing [Halorubrum lacusprofundi ATCC 49239]
MCGIIGYVGELDSGGQTDGGAVDSVGAIVHEGLRNLEYRGYDSAGVALVGASSGLTVAKRSGEVDGLTVPDVPDATHGVGHTRWSTHGPPTDANAHPHTDCAGDVAVVHNGIVENYEALKAELSDHEFTSDTDTEVIPHLIEEELAADPDADLLAAVRRVEDRLEGSYAICAVREGNDRIIVARRGSPLVLGRGENASFVASDVTAFLEHTRDVTYLEDGDVAALSPDGVEIVARGEPVEREVETVTWEADAAEKGGYDHYMRKEIHEQPESLRQTLAGRLDVDAGDVDLDVSFPPGFLADLEEIRIVACGTSYYAGRYAARLFEDLAGVRATVEIASEYEFGAGRTPDRTLVVAVTQSGETADTLGAVRRANAAGARTFAVTNTLGSTVTREVDGTAFIRAGPEIGVAATKTFASQVATLAMLAVAVGRDRGALGAADARSVLEDLRGLPGAVQQVLDEEEQVREAAREYGDGEAFFFVGRALGVPVALEGALKLKEISYDHAEGFAAGELKHGPLALVTPETPVLAVLTDGARADETMNNVTEAQTRGAPALGCVSAGDEYDTLDVSFEVPDVGVVEPLVANVYLQLFAYHVANDKGRAIDKPRNLAKSVTVE